MSSSMWPPEKLNLMSDLFEERSPQAALRWAFKTFGKDAVTGTGFGYSGVALMHMLSEVRPGATVFYIDTDLFFPETYELHDKLAERLDLNIERVHSGVSLDGQAERHGAELWNRNPDQCCFIRKVRPLRHYLADKRAWITGLRRDQSPSRANTKVVEWNAANEVIKINPLAAWTAKDVWNYIHAHDLLYNPLHDAGFPSIGCIPCTKPVASSDDERAGRWAGTSKTECGLHLKTQSA